MKFIKIPIQIGVIIAITEVGKWLSSTFHLPLPGNILGMLMLFILLTTGLFKLEWIEEGANLILKYMALFFIPAGVGLLGHFDTIQSNLVGFLTVVLLSTIIVLVVTGYATELSISMQNRLRARKKEA